MGEASWSSKLGGSNGNGNGRVNVERSSGVRLSGDVAGWPRKSAARVNAVFG